MARAQGASRLGIGEGQQHNSRHRWPATTTCTSHAQSRDQGPNQPLASLSSLSQVINLLKKSQHHHQCHHHHSHEQEEGEQAQEQERLG